MFQAGEANEDLWEKVLVQGWEGQVLRNQKVQRQGSWGTVMGSPDIVLADKDGTWNTVLELKLLSAANSTIARVHEGEPDSKHLVQAATYMWLAETPVILCYTNRTDFAIEFRAKALGVRKIEPCYRLFYLSFKKGQLFYRDEFESFDVPTMVTVDGIKGYYARLAEMSESHQLFDRPSNYGVTGKASPWDRCDPKYCPFADACNRFENDYLCWKSEVKLVCGVVQE